MKTIYLLGIGLLLNTISFAQSNSTKVLKDLDENAEVYSAIANTIWEYAELGYQEEKSSTLLQNTLQNEGFDLKVGVADIPTAFIAEYGSGKPVIAFLGEYDALPGLSQQAIAEKKSAGKNAGHACGHHLLGTASVAAAISVKNWLQANNIVGTIRYYGCPAEEGGSGKVYMSRAGLFNDVDAVLDWHPSNKNSANPKVRLANTSAKFRFYGVSAHASAAPDKGRSAIDAVEAMNYMVNLMREHIPQESRIHYVITDGGKAPNVVPDFAEVYYYVRHPNRETVIDIFNRVVQASKGAALGTGTTTDYELIGGTHEMLHNFTLQELLYKNLVKIGGYHYNEEEKAFANKISRSLNKDMPDTTYTHGVLPYSTTLNPKGAGSSDVGDVSFNAPTGTFVAATWVPDTPAHSWQAVAAGGTTIGIKGMMVAAKTLTATAIDLFSDHHIIETAQAEFQNVRGENYSYQPLLGDRAPALDYRN
ncbi:amidohydrolase [Aestuariivivens sediminicola]|uniref:amidohydrolase n=1 Tax=Aestuariivivens sediminicola TaxID=2913560 RepID=UPI001F564949|nr:amidohydrolase [Aestuariivivens sediminicola]